MGSLRVAVLFLLVLGDCKLASPYAITLLGNRNALLTIDEINQMMFKGLSQGNEKMLRIQIPTGDVETDVIFGLYTRLNNDSFEQLRVGDAQALSNSSFSFAKQTKIIIHGFLNNMESPVIQTVKNSFLDNYDFNVIGVDWGAIANDPVYSVAVGQVENVGKYVAQFIDFLVVSGVRPNDIHLIGHSLGAHVCGYAGQYMTTGKPSRISGMDPALPLFYTSGPDGRLDPTDAKFVDCIHTCGGVYGFLSPICSVDFYPNGGLPLQPGCPPDLGICSHSRSYFYFAESIYPDHVFPSEFCQTTPDRGGDGCQPSNVEMGFYTPSNVTGIFWSRTESSAPFAPKVDLLRRHRTRE